ncbi:MAG: hypothetical protein P8Y44_10315 [Acidobacteriota bacterium]
MSYASLLLRDGRVEEAEKLLSRFLELTGNDPGLRLNIEATVRHYAGDSEAAEAAMTQYEEEYCDNEPSACALFYGMRNDPDAAFDWLERSYAMREPALIWCKADSTLSKLREDPRWDPFWQKVGFPAN